MAEAETLVSTESEAVFDIVCMPCSKDGQHKEAVSYCCECRGNLCRDCVRDHRDIRSLKHHQLTDKIIKDVNKIRASHVADINMKSTRKTTTSFLFQKIFGTKSTDYCLISGMTVVGDDKVIAADWNLYTIKLIDTTNNAIVDEHKLDGRPWDVTTCKDTIAVTLPTANKIVFLKYAGGLVHDREISVNGDCWGIDWYNDKLYVILRNEKKLEVMTPTGVVLQTFSTTADDKHLFHLPGYVTVNAANQRIYVSEFSDRVVVLDMAGNQTGTYEDRELGRPKQLAITRAGMMFLCDCKSDTVHLLSPAGEKANILLTKQDGVNRPYSVCYYENTGRLYIGFGMRDCDTIKVYKLSFENL